MPADSLRVFLVASPGALAILYVLRRLTPLRFPLDDYVPYLGLLFLSFSISELAGFKFGAWILAALSFLALREYLTLVDVRIQDRLAILGAFLSVPFMFYFLAIDWYGMFIVSIPVYGFLVVPFLVALGGREARGTVLSIGAIAFGLFLFVYCVGHVGYLALLSTGKAVFLVVAVVLCDLVTRLVRPGAAAGLGRTLSRLAVASPLAVLLALGLRSWTGLPRLHAVALGLLIPSLAAIGRYTIAYIEADLGIDRREALPGRGRVIDSLKSFLYTAPVVFHYVRYFDL